VVFADVGDVVEIDVEPAAEAVDECRSVVVRGPFASALEAALPRGAPLSVETACALACEAARPRRFSVAMTLEKNLPVAAGLGGGTADGAAVLRALARAFELGWSAERLAEAALAIGADGPACALGRALMMRGVGEALTPLVAWPALDVVLANPLKPTETRAVFEAFAAQGAGFSAPHEPPPVTRDREQALAYLVGARNDLEAAAAEVEPAVSETLAALRVLEGVRLVRLSGSGATCWAAFDDARTARRAAERLQHERPDWWIAAAKLAGTA
jgi:4-diphosphocytidyl-2-C-methyl-D-erythritol kinase